MTRAMDACADQETIVCATRVRERVTRDRTLLQEGAAPVMAVGAALVFIPLLSCFASIRR
jgi:hypothetical protein